jgi:folate-binding protein YgfZ
VRDFLQGLVTNDVAGDLPVWAGLLTPQGKALFDFIVWADGDDLLVDCEAAQAEGLARRLKMYRLRLPITIQIDAELAVHWALDDRSGSPDPRDVRLGRRWIAPPDKAATDWHAHRLSLGIVEGVAELGTDATLWLEANAREQNGVSFTKGCYVGQENTARMHHRDKVRRRLLPFGFAGDTGDGVVRDSEGRQAGTLRSFGHGVAIAHIRVEATAGPLSLNGAPLELLHPAWLADTLAPAAA